MTDVAVARRVRVTIARHLALPLARLGDAAEFARDLGVPGLAPLRHALDREFAIRLSETAAAP
jgi:hypothetical protein